MKLFIYRTSLLALPVLFVLILVNYFGDAANIFDNTYIKNVSGMLINGNYVTNIENYDERLLQKELISNEKGIPKIAVLGSSRTMLLNSEILEENKFFNYSVSGASIEDLVSIYQLLKENHKLPQEIIIGIDPWTFNENNGLNRWRSISTYYFNFNERKNEAVNPTFFKLGQLVSLSYFQSAVKNLPNKFSKENEPIPTKSKFNVSATKLTDGSLIYGKIIREASDKEIEEKVSSLQTSALYGIQDFNLISEKIVNEFKNLMSDMRKNNIKINFFLSPYHPTLFPKIEKKYPMVLATEKMIRDYSKLDTIKVYGSFNPNELGLGGSYFIDEMHCKDIGIQKIVQLNNK